MPLILGAKAQKHLIQLADVIFCERHIVIGQKDQAHGFGIACDFLLITGLKSLPLDVGKQRLNLNVAELCSFDSGGGETLSTLASLRRALGRSCKSFF